MTKYSYSESSTSSLRVLKVRRAVIMVLNKETKKWLTVDSAVSGDTRVNNKES